MSELRVIKAEARQASGKGSARRARAEGKIPAVIYGSGKDADSITLDGHDLLMAMQAGGFFTNVQEIEVDGKKHKVLAREIQREPVFDKVLHVDFLRFDAKRKVHVNVPVRLIEEELSPGIKIGGIVSFVRPEVELVCRADSIPNELVGSLKGLEIGDSLNISAIELPEGVEPAIHDRDFTIASIVSTRTSQKADADEDGVGGDEGTEDGETTEEAAE